MEETMLLSDEAGNSIGDPMVMVRRYAWLFFFFCLFCMGCLAFRDNLVNAALGAVSSVR